MRGVTAGAVLATLAGCSGEDPFTVPEYVGGILLQGDCPDDVEGTNLEGMEDLWSLMDPNLHLEEFDDEPGRVLHDQASFNDMLLRMNFGVYWNIDWAHQQVAAVWYHQPHGCEVNIELDKVVLRTATDGGIILDAQ